VETWKSDDDRGERFGQAGSEDLTGYNLLFIHNPRGIFQCGFDISLTQIRVAFQNSLHGIATGTIPRILRT
jgi:hypothetical protein